MSCKFNFHQIFYMTLPSEWKYILLWYRTIFQVVTDNAGKVKAGKQVYPHFTNATDTNNIKTVFIDVSDIIIQKLLGENIYS